MLEPKAVIRFSLIAVVVYGALTWTFPSFERAYASYFRTVGNAAFSQFWFWSHARVDFVDLQSETLLRKVNAKLPAKLPLGFKLPAASGVTDTLMILKNSRTPAFPGFLRTSSRIIGYTPMAVLIALIAATPVAIKRRFWLMFWGMLVIHGAIVIRLTVLLLDAGFADPTKKYAIWHPGPFMTDVVNRARVVLADNPTFAYVVAVFVWIFVLFCVQAWYDWRPDRKKSETKINTR